MKLFEHDELNTLLSERPWRIHQSEYDPEQNLNYETLFTLTNGYMGVRGSLEEGAHPQHPGTLIAGVFDTSEAEAKTIVNAPNWLPMRLYAHGEPFSPDRFELSSFERILDMQKALLFRKTIFRAKNGFETLVEGYRFLSRADPHLAGITLCVKPLNWEGLIGLESVIDGTAANSAFDPRRRVKHLALKENSFVRSADIGYLEMATRDLDIRIGTAAALRIIDVKTGADAAAFKRLAAFGERCVDYREIEAEKEHTYRIEKYVVVYTSRDVARRRVKSAVAESMEQFLTSGMGARLEKHAESYRRLWELSDIRIAGDDEADRSLRFNIFHLMSTYTGEDPDVNIGAKGLHGEGYKGQTFWDTEIYLLPFFLYTRPEAAKALLMYRYNRLDAARENAISNRCRGAQFPWNSADTGLEESVKWSTTIAGDRIRFHAETQLHIVAAVAYAVWEYVRVTGETNFLHEYGGEILLETARFWVSRSIYNKEKDRYEIRNVIGPDEYHLYVDNSFYTNFFARWNLRTALRLLEEWKSGCPGVYQDVARRIGLTVEETDSWVEVAAKMYIPMDEETGLAEQFEGYFRLQDLVIAEYDENSMPQWPTGLDIHRLNETQLIKQADVVLAMLLLRDHFDEKTRRVNYDYYSKRTMHKSTLSASIYSIMGLSLGDASEAYRCFMRTATTDLVDSQGSTWQGIHIASMGGTWQAAIFGFAGMHVDADGLLHFNPRLPRRWKEMAFRVLFRRNIFEIRLTHRGTEAKLLESDSPRANIKINGRPVIVEKT